MMPRDRQAGDVLTETQIPKLGIPRRFVETINLHPDEAPAQLDDPTVAVGETAGC
jgi:hypothetical protein